MPMEAAMTALPLAHAGHYALYVLYAVPVLVVIGSIVLERRSATAARGGTRQ